MKPLDKLSVDLLKWVIRLRTNLPKSHKHTIGLKLEELSSDIISDIIDAKFELSPNIRINILSNIRRSVIKISTYLKVSNDENIITNNEYLSAAGMLDEITRQLTNWSNKTKLSIDETEY